MWFILSTGVALRVYLRGFFTEWQVVPIASLERPEQLIPLDSPSVRVLSHDRMGAFLGTRNWAGLLRARLGADMQGLYAGHVCLHVYFHGMMLLTFEAKERCDDGELFMTWLEDD